MSLLAIVYKSLFIFGVLFISVVSFSYVAFKIRQKRGYLIKHSSSKLVPSLAVAGYSQNSEIKKNVNTRYFYGNQTKQKSANLRNMVISNNPVHIQTDFKTRQLYTRIANLTEETLQNNKKSFPRKRAVKNNSEISHNMKIRLEGFNIFDYYEEDSREEFYRFKTKA